MKPIIQLTTSLINKIAAGEVVERPLSVVKELTENAIDAGASIITVEISDGGLSSIRVTDNGAGISSEDLPLAFARHATSKITNMDDLFHVETLGFRGEALSSISAVAQVEMITKTHHAVMGTRVEIHGGKLLTSRDIGCANGTTLVVSNLFFNTPARRKFLKKPATEAAYISDCLERLALGNPGLTLRYINNSKLVFQTNGNGDLKTALLNVYGREVATQVVPVDAKTDTNFGEYKLTGLMGKPQIARGNRGHGSFFINGRYIQSKLLSNAVESAMKTMLPSGRFPVYALNLTMPFDALDVNVHPTKMDVRFADEESVFDFVKNAVQESLESQNLIHTVRHKVKEKPTPIEKEQMPLFMANRPDGRQDIVVINEEEPKKKLSEKESLSYLHKLAEDTRATVFSKADALTHETKQTTGLSLKEEPALAPSAPFFNNYQMTGLIFGTYWLITQEESLYLIDQHAAHERVLYENLLKKAEAEKIHAQQLLIPIPLRLTPMEKQRLNENKEIFANFGFEIGGDIDSPEIISVPVMIKGPVDSTFFTEILDKMSDVGFSSKSPYTHKAELIAVAACKAAIKSGDLTTKEEAEALIRQLLELENPFTCPHGRPTIIEMKKSEIERRFKRS